MTGRLAAKRRAGREPWRSYAGSGAGDGIGHHLPELEVDRCQACRSETVSGSSSTQSAVSADPVTFRVYPRQGALPLVGADVKLDSLRKGLPGKA